MSYPKLLEPLTIAGKGQLRNRVVMGSMHTGLESYSLLTGYESLARFYEERAKGGVGLIITGGFTPSSEGPVVPLERPIKPRHVRALREVTSRVHKHGGKIVLQMLHTGRYAMALSTVAPSPLTSPISRTGRPPREMSAELIQRTVQDYVHLAKMAQEANFDGVEVMGSEGYLLNQFTAPHTNHRTDEYGGCFENRVRFPLEVLKAVRAAVDDAFLVIYRASLLDLVPNGSTQEEVFDLAELVAKNGADIINTGIGWHEARIPTIATSVPRGGYTWATRAVREHLRHKGIDTPLIAVNRMNHPDIIEEVLQRGDADLVGMARPLLSDPFFVQKVAEGHAKLINVCIGCNEACLDNIFRNKTASCMLNPEACHETSRALTPAPRSKKIAVVGGGPAGCSCALAMARRGHRVTLFEKNSTLGGQFNLAKRIPGKEEFQSSINYWTNALQHEPNVTLRLGQEANPGIMVNEGFSEVVMATGCGPRAKSNSTIPGIEGKPNVFSYTEALLHPEKVGQRVAVIGSGGIGYDMAEFLAAPPVPVPTQETHHHKQQETEAFLSHWGVVSPEKARGGVADPVPATVARQVTVFQRSKGKPGANLGATTGWIHRLELRKHKVQIVPGVTYKSFDGSVLQYEHKGELKELTVDSIVLCTGQESNTYFHKMAPDCMKIHMIGGCKDTKKLDAVGAILQAHELAMKI